ncbi:MAG: hypothetical protein K6A96_05535 [Prevotella sp.]|nr:hypothetical protein [Prevotella sp.]
MSKLDKNWEKDFSVFERDLDVPEGKGAAADDLDFSHLEMDFSLPETSVEETQAKSDPVIILPQVPEEEPPAVEPTPVIIEEPQRRVFPPLTGDDMTKLATRLEKAIETAIPMRDQAQRMIKDHANIRLPKGLRTTSSLLCDIVHVLIATKALINLYLELGVEPLYQSVDDHRLKTTTANTISTLLAHVPTMQEGLDDVESKMNEGYDRPSANLRIRIIKAQALTTQSLAIQQAQALAQTIEAFPLENGALRVLCLLQEKGNQEVMNSMDRTMEIAGHVQVPVADAPVMLEAVRNNDQKAVDAIIRKKLLTPNF